MSFSDVLLMMFSAILVENFIFSRFYGCCPSSAFPKSRIPRSGWAWR